MQKAFILALLCALSFASFISAQNVQLVQATIRGDYLHTGVSGLATFGIFPGSTDVQINVTLTGLDAGSYAIHVHVFGDTTTGTDASNPISTNATGYGVGNHFNPDNQPHGCYPNTTRHVGDIGTIDVAGPASSSTFVTLTRDLIQLTGNHASIVGRAVVLHANQDFCQTFQPSGNSGSPIAQGVIGIIDPVPRGFSGPNDAIQVLTAQPPSLIAVMRGTTTSGLNIQGTVCFGWNPLTSKVRVLVSITGFNANTTHGIHVHQWGDDTSADGLITAGHYNPLGATHALPPTNPRHFGDLGNLQVDATGTGSMDQEFDIIQLIPLNPATSTANIVGRGVVVHQLADDGVTQPTGNAGQRYAVGVIGISDRPLSGAPVAPVSSTGGSAPAQSSTGGSSPSPTGSGTPTGSTICDRLVTAQGLDPTSATATTQALTNFLARAFLGYSPASGSSFPGWYNNANTARFFNGQAQYRYQGDPATTIVPGPNAYISPDFGAPSNSNLLNMLVTSLVTYFGQVGVFGCSNIAPYDGAQDLGAVHRQMNVTAVIFSAFNNQLVQSLASFGLTSDDQTALTSILATFGRNGATHMVEICREPDCPCASTVTGIACDQLVQNASASKVASIFVVIGTILIGMLAQRI